MVIAFNMVYYSSVDDGHSVVFIIITHVYSYTLSLPIANTGTIAVDTLSFTIAEKESPHLPPPVTSNLSPAEATYLSKVEVDGPPHPFSWDDDVIKKNLPLKPNSSFVLPIKIHPSAAWYGDNDGGPC